MSTGDCVCRTPPFRYTDFDERAVGVDETGGRFAEVTVARCKVCSQYWLRYFYEFEAFTASGRWYRAAVSEEEAASATPSNALELLGRQPWHFRGGSFFGTAGVQCNYRLNPATVR
jgi:hypothetical protein